MFRFTMIALLVAVFAMNAVQHAEAQFMSGADLELDLGIDNAGAGRLIAYHTSY